MPQETCQLPFGMSEQQFMLLAIQLQAYHDTDAYLTSLLPPSSYRVELLPSRPEFSMPYRISDMDVNSLPLVPATRQQIFENFLVTSSSFQGSLPDC